MRACIDLSTWVPRGVRFSGHAHGFLTAGRVAPRGARPAPLSGGLPCLCLAGAPCRGFLSVVLRRITAMNTTAELETAGPALEVLRRVFGYDAFRGHQQEAIQHVIDGCGALVLMPTGGGKSLCYQIPALVRPGTAVVVSPLIAL